MTTAIEYVNESWNPIQERRKGKTGRGYHCTKISDGCRHCWAERFNIRFGNGLPFDDSPVEFELIQKAFEQLLHWKKPRRVLVQPMGDLFHNYVPPQLILSIFQQIAQRPEHTYFILTKRPARMLMLLKWDEFKMQSGFIGANYPPNIYLGVTIESGKYIHRIDDLLQIPGKHWVSVEPMLGPVDISQTVTYWDDPSAGINWVIAGCESGPGRRPAKIEWFQDLKNQCVLAGVPFFLKQIQGNDGRVYHMPFMDGKVWDQMP